MTNSGWLILGTVIAVSAANDLAFAQSLDCPRVDLSALRSIEDHGKNMDVFSDRLFAAGLILQHARKACRDSRTIEARALYQSIFALVGDFKTIKQIDVGAPNEKSASCN